MVNSILRNFYAKHKRIRNQISKSILLSNSCIHGHFLPYKYSFFKNDQVSFIIWIRDPIERLISHYSFIIKENKRNETVSPFHKKVIREKWSLERFCFDETSRNLFSKFLWNFPIRRFDFIGSIDNYELDLALFRKVCCKNVTSKVFKSNVTSPKITLPSELLLKVRRFHNDDYLIYEKLRARRLELISKSDGIL